MAEMCIVLLNINVLVYCCFFSNLENAALFFLIITEPLRPS